MGKSQGAYYRTTSIKGKIRGYYKNNRPGNPTT